MYNNGTFVVCMRVIYLLQVVIKLSDLVKLNASLSPSPVVSGDYGCCDSRYYMDLINVLFNPSHVPCFIVG